MNEDFVMSDHTIGGAHVRGSTINESQNEQLKEDQQIELPKFQENLKEVIEEESR